MREDDIVTLEKEDASIKFNFRPGHRSACPPTMCAKAKGGLVRLCVETWSLLFG